MKPGSLARSLLAALFLLSACSSPPVAPITPGPAPTSTPAPSQAALITPEAPTPTSEGPLNLRVWLPPFLAASEDDAAANLLRSRLEEFQTRNPNVIIETRLKAETGPGGLLDSLVTSNAAAPAALPDLIALPRDLLEAATLKGLLLPFDSLTASLSDPDWYPYALELAYIQDDIYGLPFMGDALVQVYQTDQITQTLKSWSSVIEAGKPLLFPAASEQAYFTLLQYMSSGGIIQDQQGRPTLNSVDLTEVLTFYQSAVQAGSMSEAVLTQLQTDAQVWEAFKQTESGQISTWASSYLHNRSEGLAVTPPPTFDGKPYTLATGWVWALVGRDEPKRRLAVDLAEYLTESQFLAAWSQAAGYLPTRPSALAGWSDASLQPVLAEIAGSAHLLPSTDVRSSLQAPLGQAAIAVIKGQSDPISAAQAAAASLAVP
ncbi:MAG: extracellular solute-binding protein [Anaerolineales bacterium]|nr:extracellular solute-binding protein [Anaerolineales bacterium]